MRALGAGADDLRESQGANEAQILLPIDQAEELFGVTEPDEAEQFLVVLKALLDEQPAVHRGHDVPLRLSGSAAKVANLRRSRNSRSGRCRSSACAQIIEGPAKVAGLTVEDGFVSRPP